MDLDADILIAGGGLNGTATALALASAGFHVMLVEPRSRAERKADDFDGRSYAFAISSMRVLQALGVWPRLKDVQPILRIKVTDGRPGEGPSPLMLTFDHGEIEEGPMGYMVEDRHLRPELLNAVGDSGVTQLDDRVIGHRADGAGVQATLGSGATRRVRLLIGCDGQTSPIARRVGIRRMGWSYDQTALVCTIAHEQPHQGIAHQFFIPAGPLAILPLSGNRSSIVWTERAGRAEIVQAMSESDYLDELRPRFGRFLGDVSLAGRRFAYPLRLSIAERFIADRMALVGDAAHVVHPLAGQGLNAGLKDVAALAEVVTDAARRGEDIGRPEVLKRYEQWRRFDTMALAAATDGFNRLFSNDVALLRGLRDVGLGLTNAIPGLRRALIREAAGLTGDLPRLSRGKGL
ncbi:MAG: 2-octaprenyl-6-methoxyphenyl hydroxylase [Boseongicola sp. SB0675_bin_26]|nr:2-octaprenyl-6-methoxyphenyl hydroxylase [Boseongicola sp. SB0675_bin_26]